MNVRKVLVLLIAVLTTGLTQAIIIRHDVAPALYEVRESDYAAVFYIEQQGARRVCAATVIHARWAVTAAHCTEQTSLGSAIKNGLQFAVLVNGQPREIDAMIVHPEYDQASRSDVDLALLRFEQPATDPLPMPLFTGDDELHQEVSLLGWGYYGIGTTGRQFDDATLRLANNRVEDADRRIRILFDDPHQRPESAALRLEGMPSLGDSGGPALIRTVTGYSLAGVAVGELRGEDYSEQSQGNYGSIAVYERISRHLDWIEAVIGATYPFDS